MIEKIFLSFTVISLFVMVVYAYILYQYTSVWKNIAKMNPDSLKSNYQTKVSIVIAMRNEEDTIKRCLISLIHQNYPSDLSEIIIADDASTDGSAEAVKNIQMEFPRFSIKLIAVPEVFHNPSPKKRALDIGIHAACGGLILTCDADSEVGENWIASMVDLYEKTHCKMICGPVKIMKEPGSGWIHEFQRLDCVALVASSGAALVNNRPLMCNGSNLAFEKQAYMAISNEIKGKNLASGDDVFLMLAIHEKFTDGLKFIFRKDAMVITSAQKSLKALFSQRKRWASKSRFYKNNYILLISSLVAVINLMLLISAAISFNNAKFFIIFLGLFLSKTCFDFMLIRASGEHYGENVNYLKLLLLELFYPFLIAGLMLGSFSNGYDWKNRKLN